MTRYTLAVTWEDGRTERHPVPEPGAGPEIMATGVPVITLGPVASGIGPERIPVYRPDGPTVAVCEVWGPEYPGIVLHEDTADSDLDVTPLAVGFDLRREGIAVVLPASARVVRFDLAGETHTAIGDRATLRAALEAAGYTVEADADRDTYLARFGTRTEAVCFEERVLAIGSDFLPAHAIAVRDGAEPSPKYWAWLCDQHAAVETEAQVEPSPSPRPADTMRPLADQIRTASERLREAQAEHLAGWCDLFTALGRALQPAASNDTAETRRWLIEAESAEYDLRGDCDETGRVVEAIDGAVTS